MKMPGFAAEVSLGQTNEPYRTNRSSMRLVQEVMQQQHEHIPLKIPLEHPEPPHAHVTCAEDGSWCVVAWYTSDRHLIAVIPYWL